MTTEELIRRLKIEREQAARNIPHGLNADDYYVKRQVLMAITRRIEYLEGCLLI